MNRACMHFGVSHLTAADIHGKAVLEVGSRNVNGSLRWHVAALEPVSYVGVDAVPGPGVDEICSAEQLVQHFGPNAFDTVFSTEMLEHVRDWRATVSNLKGVLKPGGILLFTTRSVGFGFHGYPFDFWRYELADVVALFDDFETLTLEPDTSEPGVFFKGRKPVGWKERPLHDYMLYSIILGRRTISVRNTDVLAYRIVYLARVAAAHVLPRSVRRSLKKLLGIHAGS